MICNMILCGVGGQGVLSLAAIIAKASLSAHLNVRQSEVHGMSQRGGEVSSHLRIGNEEIVGDLVPSGTADLIISMEPMESLRYLNYLKPNGIVITASEPVKNISNYPDVNAVYAKIAEIPGSICLEAESLAEAAGSRRASNMVLIGAASSFLPLETDELQNAIRETFASKGESIVETNLKAFDAGRRFQNPD